MNDVTRLLSAWLKHPEHGVNALQALLPRKRFDGTDDAAPSVLTIYDDVDSDGLQLDTLDPPSSPGLVVYVNAVVKSTESTNRRWASAKNVQLIAAYMTQDEDAHVAKLNSGYAMRATAHSLYRYDRLELSREYRALNGTRILQVRTVTVTPVGGGKGKSKLWAFAQAQLDVLDEFPQ